MILHLGSDYIVPLQDVIAIIDAEAVSKSQDTKQFLERKMKDFMFSCCQHEEIKSYILAKKKNEFCVYASAISSQTLLKRTCINTALKNW